MTSQTGKTLLAGLWRMNITPPLPLEEVESRPDLEVFDDMFANALVLDDGEKELAIVSVDTINIPIVLAKKIMAAVSDR